MAKELPENIEALQGMEFEEIKKAAFNIKKMKMDLDKAIEKNDFKRLEQVKMQADRALEHLEQYTEILNKERCLSEALRVKAREFLKSL